jgi:hypothetical protein
MGRLHELEGTVNTDMPAWKLWHDDKPIRIGISSCLLGQKVRYDGGHKHDVSYMQGQFYLEPHPKELMLRNRV